jgi:hypothetical protein
MIPFASAIVRSRGPRSSRTTKPEKSGAISASAAASAMSIVAIIGSEVSGAIALPLIP